jgi:hypothetical protein
MCGRLRDVLGSRHCAPDRPIDETASCREALEHKRYAASEAKLLLTEPRAVLNTGAEASDRTCS